MAQISDIGFWSPSLFSLIFSVNRSEHISGFLFVGLSLSRLHGSVPCFLLVFPRSSADLCTVRCFFASTIYLVSLRRVTVSALQFNNGSDFLLASGPLGPIQFCKQAWFSLLLVVSSEVQPAPFAVQCPARVSLGAWID
jgi:hypothetical protein